nr:replication initiator [Brachybacterium alimentarium]
MSEKASRDLLRVQFAKVGEYQKRGAIHLHALVRLDGAPTGEEPFPSPAIDVPVSWLAERCLEAAQDVEVDAAPVDGNDSARALRFGRQVDARPVQRYTDDGGDVSPEMVAAYLAKYATKAAGDVAAEGAPNRHLKRLRETCLELCGRALLADGFASPYALLGKWADALGFRGHFASKSRRFSTTLGTLRDVRRKYHRDRERLETSAGSSGTADSFDVTEHTVVINEFRFLGQGWLTPGDAELARSAADAAREWKDSRRAALRLHEKGKNHGKALLHR